MRAVPRTPKRLPAVALVTLVPFAGSCAGVRERQAGAGSPPEGAAHTVQAPGPGELAAGDEAGAGPPSGEPRETTPAEPPAPPPLPADYLRFKAACTSGTRVVIGAVGDVLLHRELQRHAAEDPRRFRAIWADVAPLLAVPHVTYANLEGPLAPGLDRDGNEVPDPGLNYDGVVYSGYPRFNYHPSVAVDLARDGVDVVSTANNHALDRGSAGVDATMASLRKAGLPSTGTRSSDRLDAPWYTTTTVGEGDEALTVAWLACTRHTNQRPDDLHQVLRCDRDRREVTRTIKALSRRDDVDAVIVTPHVGKQYVAEPSARDREYARGFIDAGATAVIASHPHVVKPWEKYVTADGREGFILYSLGNFVSHQPELPRRTTLMLYLGLVRGDDGKTRVEGVRYAPIHVEREGDRFLARPVHRVEGPADSRDLLTALLGASNLVEPAEVMETGQVEVAPHCDQAWRPERTPAPAPTAAPEIDTETATP